MAVMTAASPSASPTVPGAIPEHAVVRLRRSLAAQGLVSGAVGAVVHVYLDGGSYEVEILDGREKPCLVTLTAKDLEIITNKGACPSTDHMDSGRGQASPAGDGASE